jgi:hypothetical protein
VAHRLDGVDYCLDLPNVKDYIWTNDEKAKEDGYDPTPTNTGKHGIIGTNAIGTAINARFGS